MSGKDDRSDFERMFAEKRALEDAFAAQIGPNVRRVRSDKPDWPSRSEYPNRKAYLAACAQWRKAHP